MMTRRRTLLLAAAIMLSLNAARAQCETLWWDDFNVDSSDLYDVLIMNPGRDGVVFEFDYGTVGIPEAPGSEAGRTTGVKFFVNDPFEETDPRTSGVQIALQALFDELDGSDYSLTYDLWMNVNGPLPAGGGGSTEAMMVGVGFNAVIPIEAGNIDGTYFTLTGEAQVATDVRSFTNDGYNATNEDGSPINVASEDLQDDYYAGVFPGGIDVGALAVQGGQNQQTGVTEQGQMAFQWHQVQVDVRGTEVSFFVDGLLIARDKDADVEGTIMIGHADYFSSVTDVPEWNFSVIDNLRVFTPEVGDFNGSGALDAPDIDTLTRAVATLDKSSIYDLNGDSQVDAADVTFWVIDLYGSWIGDADLDGEFNSSDLVIVLASGTYESDVDSAWTSGDFNADGRTNSGDLVAALADGGYETGPRAAVASVPEPSAATLASMAGWLVCVLSRRRVLGKWGSGSWPRGS